MNECDDGETGEEMNEGDEMVDTCKCKSMQFLSATRKVCQGNHRKTQRAISNQALRSH